MPRSPVKGVAPALVPSCRTARKTRLVSCSAMAVTRAIVSRAAPPAISPKSPATLDPHCPVRLEPAIRPSCQAARKTRPASCSARATPRAITSRAALPATLPRSPVKGVAPACRPSCRRTALPMRGASWCALGNLPAQASKWFQWGQLDRSWTSQAAVLL